MNDLFSAEYFAYVASAYAVFLITLGSFFVWIILIYRLRKNIIQRLQNRNLEHLDIGNPNDKIT